MHWDELRRSLHGVEHSVPTVPVVFSKFGSCIIGPGEGIPRYGPSVSSSLSPSSSSAQQESVVPSHGGMNANLDDHPTVTSQLDYEVELGIVIVFIVPKVTSSKDAHNYILEDIP